MPFALWSPGESVSFLYSFFPPTPTPLAARPTRRSADLFLLKGRGNFKRRRQSDAAEKKWKIKGAKCAPTIFYSVKYLKRTTKCKNQLWSLNVSFPQSAVRKRKERNKISWSEKKYICTYSKVSLQLWILKEETTSCKLRARWSRCFRWSELSVENIREFVPQPPNENQLWRCWTLTLLLTDSL